MATDADNPTMPTTGRRVFTEDDKQIALAFLERLGDIRKAARKANVPEAALRFWHSGGSVEASAALFDESGATRPQPPPALLDTLRYPERFEPADTLRDWVLKTFLHSQGPLYNADHAHLYGLAERGRLAFLWTNAPHTKQQKQVAGTCEIPNVQGGRWVKARMEYQLAQWFGDVPQFLITLDSVYCGLADDARFCALIEHELYHAGQAVDQWGVPRYGRDGEPIFAIVGHDVEEFVGVTARYGAAASAGRTADLVAAANTPPLIASATISAACGTCG
jgi:hypothetical protein